VKSTTVKSTTVKSTTVKSTTVESPAANDDKPMPVAKRRARKPQGKRGPEQVASEDHNSPVGLGDHVPAFLLR